MDINENVFINGKLILTGSLTQKAKQMNLVSNGPTSMVISASLNSSTELATAFIKLITKQSETLNFGSIVPTSLEVPCIVGIVPSDSRDPENTIYPGAKKDALLISNNNSSGSIQFGINNSVVLTLRDSSGTDFHLAKNGSVLRLGNSSGSVNIDDGNLLSYHSSSIEFCEASRTGSMDHGVSINFTSSQTPDGFNPAVPQMGYFDIRGHSGSVDGTITVKIPKDGKKIGFGNFPIDKMPEAQAHIYAGESSTTFENTTFAIENTGALQADFAMHVVTNPGTAFCIKNNGDVGIGKSDPNYALEVEGSGDLYAHDWVGAGNYFYIGSEIRHSNNIDNKIVFGTDTQQFKTNDITRLKIDAAGHVTKPSQPCFRAKATTSQSNIATGIWTKINFTTQLHDTNADYNNGTSVFVAPVAGKYYFYYCLRVQSLDTDSSYSWIRFNAGGSAIQATLLSPNAFSQDITYFPFASSRVLDLDANDNVFLQYYQHGGAAQTDIHTDSEWGGYLIG